jgi:PadR family transcriptional regulator PadR
MEPPITAKAALLQALVSGPGYGLDLIERVQTQTKGKLVLGQGSVYPALRDLERDGLLESYESEPLPERGGRPRRYFKLTTLGTRKAREQRLTIARLFDLSDVRTTRDRRGSKLESE